jgi:PKD repeat protein
MRSVSLASYVGQTIYIAFRHYNVTDMFQLNIDDIHVGGPQAPFVNIAGPANGMTGDALTFTATSSDANSTFAWTIDGTAQNTTGATLTHTFTAAGTYEIAVTATANGLTSTAATLNVTIVSCDAITEFPWVEDFESGVINDCYTLIDNDGDGYNWDAVSGIKAHSGDVCVSSASWVQSFGALYPDNWLVTPAITLPADASNFTLSWWVIGQDASYAEEPYSVYIANGKTVADFTATTSVFDGVSTSEYEQKSVSLANYAGQTIYVAFRHYDITDMFRINLDDIRVGAGTARIENAEEANVAIFPNPVRDMLTIEGNNVKSVEVIDMDGRVVLTNDRAGKLDMSELSDGVYMVRVMSENGVSTKKIVKK